MQHDKHYDKEKASGVSGALFKMRVKPADQKLSDASVIVQYKYLANKRDKVTGEKVTLNTYLRATAVKNFFNAVINTTKNSNVRKAVKAIGKGASAIKN